MYKFIQIESVVIKIEKEIVIEGQKVKILRVPWFSQSDSDWLCLVYSLKMVLDFYKNVYENPKIRQDAPNTSRDELISVTNTQVGLGTTIADHIINKLNQTFPTMGFELKATNYREIEKALKEHTPIIVLYNPSYLFINEQGPGHAGVVIGMNDQYVILNNPWYGPAFCIDKTSFERAWELEYNWAIFIKPNPQQRLDSNAN